MKMSEPVYANVITDGTRDKDRHKRKETPQHTGSDCVKFRSSRAAAVCLVLLCVLLLAAVIVLCVHIHTKTTKHTEERDELLTRITSLTEEKDQLLTNNTNHREERDELLTKINSFTEQKDQLLTSIANLNKERDELKIKNQKVSNERDQLINQLSRLYKEDEWICYQSSVYYMSSERKNWAESRQDCLKRGADLIIINNTEENDFVKKITDKREFWIGVTDSDVEDRWKWVDGSALTSGFWATGEPNGGSGENCVVTYLEKHPELIGWLDVTCNGAYQWVCEKRIVTV